MCDFDGVSQSGMEPPTSVSETYLFCLGVVVVVLQEGQVIVLFCPTVIGIICNPVETKALLFELFRHVLIFEVNTSFMELPLVRRINCSLDSAKNAQPFISVGVGVPLQ